MLTDPHKTPDDFFASNVAISRTAAGTFAVIGAYGTDGQAGAAYLYALSGQQWHLETTLTGTMHNQNLGKSVAVSGTRHIGSWGTNNNNGVAYVYVRSGTTWHRQATLTPDRAGQILFGYSVAVSGPTAFVSAIHANNSEGLAYVFTRTGTAWREQAILTDPLGLPGDTFGNKVTISGSIAAISAAFTDNAAGAAYVFARSGSTWHLQASLSSANPASGDYFGDGVAVSGTTVLVGLPRAGLSRCGTVYEYTRSGATWRERAQLAKPNCTTKDYFGFAVAVSGKTAMSGAPGKNNSAGEVYIQALP